MSEGDETEQPSHGDVEREPLPGQAPSGLPAEEPETPPLGVPDEPGEQPEPGPDAMPGIPTDGEPPAAG